MRGDSSQRGAGRSLSAQRNRVPLGIAQRSRTQRWSWLIALPAIAAGCEKPPAKLPLQVEVSGCAALLPDKCELSLERLVRLRVTTGRPTKLEITVDGQPAKTASITEVQGASLVSLAVDETAQMLELVASAPGEKARWQLALAAQPELPVLGEAKALRAKGQSAEATQRLEQSLGTLQGHPRARVLSALARAALGQGDVTRAAERFGEAIALYLADARSSEACDDSFALAYGLAQYQQRFAESRRALEAASSAASNYPDGRARMAFYHGVIAAKTGDVRLALQHFRTAAQRAEALGLDRLARNARQELGEIFRSLGRWAEAREQLELASQGLGPAANACDRADQLTNVAWVELSARESALGHGKSGIDATTMLQNALAIVEKGCADPQRRANLQVNLALAALQSGDGDTARLALEEASAAQQPPTAPTALWRVELEGRRLLLQKKSAEALAVYQHLERLGESAASGESRWQGALGQARAYAQTGQVQKALLAYARAEDVLGELPLAVPLLEGRDTLLGEHEVSARERAALLVAKGRAAEALNVVRLARVRVLRALERGDRLAHLPVEKRARWEEAIGAFRREREALNAIAAGDWRLSTVELEEVLHQRRELEDRLASALDAAFAVLEPDRTRGAELFRKPEAGEVLLAYFPSKEGWLGFAASHTEVHAEQLVAVETGASAEQLSNVLLAPFERQLKAATRIRVLNSGALKAVDFHALPFGDSVLIQQKTVVYALDLPEVARAEKSQTERVLVIANPLSDLPQSSAEGKEVAKSWRARHSTVRVYEGAQASRSNVLDELKWAQLFHFAGHGDFAGAGGWGSALKLASGAQLSVADILSFPAVPSWVVLSGCETGSSATDTPLEGLGLAQAFILAGSHGVIATTRPVRDRAGAELSRALYGAASTTELADAFMAAQRQLHQSQPPLDWAAFRLIVP